MKKMTKNEKVALEVGAGIVAATAAAAGYYFYADKNAKKHRKIAAAWATKMKKEVMKEAKHLEEVTPRAFASVVDRVAKTYQTASNIDAADVKRAAKELKENWEIVHREAKRTIRKSVSKAKAVVKKTVKKAAKKSTRK